jgi:hypothetical protein
MSTPENDKGRTAEGGLHLCERAGAADGERRREVAAVAVDLLRQGLARQQSVRIAGVRWTGKNQGLIVGFEKKKIACDRQQTWATMAWPL